MPIMGKDADVFVINNRASVPQHHKLLLQL